MYQHEREMRSDPISICPRCGESFQRRKWNQLYCSTNCRVLHYYHQHKNRINRNRKRRYKKKAKRAWSTPLF